MMDVERAAMGAVETAFNGTEGKGCGNHLKSNVYRKIQNEGMQVEYQEDQEYSIYTRMISALAFVPIADVVRVFEHFKRIHLIALIQS